MKASYLLPNAGYCKSQYCIINILNINCGRGQASLVSARSWIQCESSNIKWLARNVLKSNILIQFASRLIEPSIFARNRVICSHALMGVAQAKKEITFVSNRNQLLIFTGCMLRDIMRLVCEVNCLLFRQNQGYQCSMPPDSIGHLLAL